MSQEDSKKESFKQNEDSGERGPSDSSSTADSPPAKTISSSVHKEDYDRRKAEGLQMPTNEKAELNPFYLFDDPTFILHMCPECRYLNRGLAPRKIDEEYQEISLRLCRICRFAFNQQRYSKYHNFNLLCLKRKHAECGK